MLSYKYNIEGAVMHKVIFYKDKNGKSEIQEYILNLQNRKDKDSRIKFNKITSYIDILSVNGIMAGEPYIKHIEDDIWELRPLRDRILFAYYDKNTFILLSIFMKTTRKTPQMEMDKAKRFLKDWSDRNEK